MNLKRFRLLDHPVVVPHAGCGRKKEAWLEFEAKNRGSPAF